MTMCLPFLKEKSESISSNILKNTPNGMIILNELLEVQQINDAARRIMNIQKASDVLGEPIIRILDPQDFINVIRTGRNIIANRIYLAEYRKFVERTIFYDKSCNFLMCVMRDVTEEEKAREEKERISRESIEITDRVVEKQMRVVQEIASLLGETTAEMKIALSKLKETIKNE
jgi:c-di-AMP phosphodiesterase-like protein